MEASRSGRGLRWTVARARLDPAVGHEQAGVRPVLVVSNDGFNRRSGLVTVVPLTTARRRPLSSEVLLTAGTAGLTVDSIALLYQVRTISQARLSGRPYGRLTEPHLRRAIALGILDHLRFEDVEAVEDEP